MALITKPLRVCDVTGATRDVRQCRVYVSAGEGDAGPVVFDKQVDLAPRGLDRLLNFIRRGLKPVGKGKGVGVGDAPPAEEPPAPPPEDVAPPTDPADFDKQLGD